MTTFQGIVLGVFSFCIVLGVVFFAISANTNQNKSIGAVTIWGTLDREAFDRALRTVGDTEGSLINATYIEKDAATLDADLSEALASGTGPDLFLLEQDAILRHQSKIAFFPYSALPQQTFTSMYIDEAKLYLTAEGALGLPLIVDPLVLYWNKDTLSMNGFAQPPSYWDEVFTMAEKISQKDASGGIIKSAIAFGEFENVLHAKDIVSALIMQAKGTVVSADSEGRVEATIDQNVSNASERPAISALRFYTTFANPAESVYSWNRSLPHSRDAFAQGKAALYVGYASERALIQDLNPNLSSAVAPIPQIRDSARSVTFGHMYAVAKPRTSNNPAGADIIASILAGRAFGESLSFELALPPVRRDVLAVGADGPMQVFYSAALIATAWLDPSSEDTDEIFKVMIESVGSGSSRISEAVDTADRYLTALLK